MIYPPHPLIYYLLRRMDLMVTKLPVHSTKTAAYGMAYSRLLKTWDDAVVCLNMGEPFFLFVWCDRIPYHNASKQTIASLLPYMHVVGVDKQIKG